MDTGAQGNILRMRRAYLQAHVSESGVSCKRHFAPWPTILVTFNGSAMPCHGRSHRRTGRGARGQLPPPPISGRVEIIRAKHNTCLIVIGVNGNKLCYYSLEMTENFCYYPPPRNTMFGWKAQTRRGYRIHRCRTPFSTKKCLVCMIRSNERLPNDSHRAPYQMQRWNIYVWGNPR